MLGTHGTALEEQGFTAIPFHLNLGVLQAFLYHPGGTAQS